MNSWSRKKWWILLFNFLVWSDNVVSTIWWNHRKVHAIDSLRFPETIADLPTKQQQEQKQQQLDDRARILNADWWSPSENCSLLSILRRSVRPHVAGLLSTYGILSSLSSDILSVRSRWHELRPTMESIQSYLNDTGITNELLSVVQHRQFWISLRKVWQIQRNQRSCQDIRNQVSWKRKQRWSSIPPMEDALRYMRFATATYGDPILQATHLSLDNVNNETESPSFFATTRKRISYHVQIPENDIIRFDVDYHGTDRQHLHHIIALDHAKKAVVLAIRGTFSLRDLVVDATAYTRPFAGGEAHHKMVDMAERTWEVAGPYVVNALQQNEDYSLTLTGHSLGAGVACLVSILCHQRGRKRVLGRNVQCFAFGCPPVFTSPELVPDAVKHTTAYIHGNDGIPFLSLSHVRRLVSKLQWMMEEMSSPTKLPLQNAFKALKRIGIVYPNTMNTVIPIPGSPILFVPACTIVWTKKVDNGKFNAKFCDPRKVTGLEIPLSANYLNDHSLTSYEGALQYLVEKNPETY